MKGSKESERGKRGRGLSYEGFQELGPFADVEAAFTLSVGTSLSVIKVELLVGVARRDVPEAGRGIAETTDRRRVCASLAADILRGVGGAGRIGDGVRWIKCHADLRGVER